MKITAALLGLAATTLAHSLRPRQITTRCGAPKPSPELLEEAAKEPTTDTGRRSAIRVETYVHVVTTNASAGVYTQTQVDRQIDVMNDAYGPAGISFKNLGTTFTVNDAWATGGLQGSVTEAQMKSTLRQGSYDTLNLYFLSDLGGGLLGYCYFPEKTLNQTIVQRDGCINLAGSLPGGDAVNYDLGLTAVHEVGHWFGVFHVFQNQSCEGKGDYVFDTPIQSVATFGCPVGQDSCPNSKGNDSITNYMDYSFDACMRQFTFGQHLKMYKNWFLYRFGK
ncbi:extracellular metalloprotease-2 [Elsinoe australis]|uniref:Extracellular metalloprotease-2 n=1 Tax=Elsinoe australis TaxID=40998 RepID=A0A4U7B098_9PEZI|nr:extracellular metalloprotease-2 [Elsinoe australis]